MLTFLAGLPTAWAYGQYIINVEKRKAIKAAIWDLVVLVLAQLITLTLWAHADNSISVLIGWIVGNVLGTYLVIKYQRRKENDKDEEIDLHSRFTAQR